MSNNTEPIKYLVGVRVIHNFSPRVVGIITKVRNNIGGYMYFVEWDSRPERNDWYKLNVLERVEL